MKINNVQILLCLFCLSVSGTLFSKSRNVSIIEINTNDKRHYIKSELFGTNLQWENSGDGILNGSKYIDRGGELIKLLKSSPFTVLRFPGGALANTYNWKGAVGDRNKRKKGKNYSKNMEDSVFGTDEFIQLLKATGWKGLVTVNISDSVQNAVEWVQYFNGDSNTPGGKLRNMSGICESVSVKYWELGNELYSPHEPGHMSAMKYAQKTQVFANKMKSADPNIKVGVNLEASFQEAAWMKGYMPHMMSWNEEVIRDIGNDIDFIILHFYAPFDKGHNDKNTKQLLWASPLVFDSTLKNIKGLLKKYNKDHLEVVVSEYNSFFGSKVKPSKRISSFESSLYNAMMMHSFIRDESIVMANHWSLMNNSEFGSLISKSAKLIKRSVYGVIELLSDHIGSRYVPVSIESRVYSVAAKGNVPVMKDVKYIDAVASVNDQDVITLSVVNRSMNEEELLIKTNKGCNDRYSVSTYYANGDQSNRVKEHKDSIVFRDCKISYKLPANSFAMFKSL